MLVVRVKEDISRDQCECGKCLVIDDVLFLLGFLCRPASPSSSPTSRYSPGSISYDIDEDSTSPSQRVLRRVRNMRPARAISRIFLEDQRNADEVSTQQKLYDDSHLRDADASTSANGVR